MKENLGAYLKDKRTEANLSQSEVASKLGYSTAQYISNFERGICQPSMKILAKLAKMYSMDLKEFFNVLVEQQKEEIHSVLFGKKKSKK